MAPSSRQSSTSPTSLKPGSRLGRYEIVSLLGVGGMGEVYRARDPRIGRDVALKVLHRRQAGDEDVARFSREARAAGSLNHPNIVAVYDVGTEGQTPYVVAELLEGETLRARLNHGRLSFRKALDYAGQIAEALAAAHAKGIWHRDVKPANAFVTDDGRVKLLDFGVAKLSERARRPGGDDPTAELSEPSDVLGTAGYMSPEQVLGEQVDHRADIFALGAVMYEMFTGQRAFKCATHVETLTAVLRAEPADPALLNPDLPPMAAAIVRRCLEKSKEERFQSARDLAFDLRHVSEGTSSSGPVRLTPARPDRGWTRWLPGAAAFAAAVALWVVWPTRPPSLEAFDPLVSNQASIGSARFASGGNAVVYSLARDDAAPELTWVDLADGLAEERDYPAGAHVLAANQASLALWVDRRFLLGERFVGSMAVAPAAGGAPLSGPDNIEGADWSPTDDVMAIVRSEGRIGGRSWLEYPAGRVLHDSEGSLSVPRFSPDGRYLAFLEDPGGRASSGSIMIVRADGGGDARALTGNYTSVRGLAWAPGNREIWFSAGDQRSQRALRAVDLRGRERIVHHLPGPVTLWDIDPGGRVLFSTDSDRRFTVGKPPGEQTERRLTTLEDAAAVDISANGELLLFADNYHLYLQPTGDPAGRIDLGLDGVFADALAPDGTHVLATTRDQSALLLAPTRLGEGDRTLPAGPIVRYSGAYWFPDSRRIVFSGNEAGQELRAYVQDIVSGLPHPVTDTIVRALAVSPFGNELASGSDEGIVIWPLEGGPPRLVPDSVADDRPVAWSPDGRFLWVFHRDKVPAPVFRVNVDTGAREDWASLQPADLTGFYSINEFKITPSGSAYFYTYRRVLSELWTAQIR